MNINQVQSGMQTMGVKPAGKPNPEKIENEESQVAKSQMQGQDAFVKSEEIGETGFYTRSAGAATTTAATMSVMTMSVAEESDADDTIVSDTTTDDADDTVVGGTTTDDADDTVVDGTTSDTTTEELTEKDLEDAQLRELADKILEMHQNSQISNFTNMLNSMFEEDELSIAYTSGTDMMLASAGVFNGTFSVSSSSSTSETSTITSTYSVEAVSDETVNWALDLVMNDPDQLDTMKDMIVSNYKNIGVNIDSSGNLVGGLNGDAGDKYEETIAALEYAAENGTMDGFNY